MIRLVLIVAVWCALWGDVTWANVLSGLAIAIAVIGVGPLVTGRLHPWPLMKLSWLVFSDLIVSTVVVAREVLTPGRRSEGFVEVRLPEAARPHLFVLTVLVTLTPGTAVARVDDDLVMLEIYTFDIDDAPAVVEHTELLADYAIAGLPTVTERPAGWGARWGSR